MRRSRSREYRYRSRRYDTDKRDYYDSRKRYERSPSPRRWRSASREGKGKSLRDISNSRERSRERERRRRKMQAECIKRAGGYQALADMEGKEPVRLFWDGFQWVAKTGHSIALQNDPALMNSTRKMRRLYFGNLPLHLGLTETSFQQIVWEEMKRRKFCSDENINPVLCVWFAKDKGNYGFVEFASVEETERALTMDGMLCMQIPLKVSRPNDYTTTSSHQNQAMALMGKQSAQMLQIQHTNTPLPAIPASSASGLMMGGSVAGGPQTRLLRVVKIVSDTTIKETELEETLEDIQQGFRGHSQIVRAALLTHEDKLEYDGKVFEQGDVILQFADSSGVDHSFISMSGRQYERKTIRMIKLNEEEYMTVVNQIFDDVKYKIG